MKQQKNLYLVKSGKLAMCKKCQSRFKTCGNVYIMENDTAVSISGAIAYRIIWRCNSGHVKNIGWTAPVDFNKPQEVK